MASFYDTNILIYSVSGDAAKVERAMNLLEGGGSISVQVLNEAARLLRHKLRYDWTAIKDILAEMRETFTVTPGTLETHELGITLAERYGFAIFDSMIVAAALQSGCDTLYSEDMHHGLVVDGVLTIANPFRS
jgi:predicted nucleic acid-binding protein